MKTLLKVFLLLALCLSVLCQNEFSIEIDALSVSMGSDLTPFFKVIKDDAIYWLRMKSIYEVEQRNDNRWYKVEGTETLFNTLQWNITTNLTDSIFALTGAPCACEDESTQNQEPNLGKRIVKGPIRRKHCHNGGSHGGNDDGGSSTPGNNDVNQGGSSGNNCTRVNFGYLKIFFQLDTNNCQSSNNVTQPVNVTQCDEGCVSSCDNSTNSTTCIAFCSTFANTATLDEPTCNNICVVDGVVDPNCVAACNTYAACLNGSTPIPDNNNGTGNGRCPLNVYYHLHNYQWSSRNNTNTSAPANTTRLAFAFEVIEQMEAPPCRTFFDNWYWGPFNLQLNVSTYAMMHQLIQGQSELDLDFSSATDVQSNLLYAPQDNVIVGRIYVDEFPTGYSIFNLPKGANMTPITQTPSRGAPEPYNFPLF